MVGIPKQSYSGRIREIALDRSGNVHMGGESCMPFYTFEGQMPKRPLIAVEINDIPPTDWAQPLVDAWSDVFGDPAAWAKKAVEEVGADIIHLQLVGTDPNGEDLPASHAVDVVKKVAAAIDVPLVVWGTANNDKDTEVLRAVAEAITDRQLLLGPIEEANYKALGAQVIAHNHVAVASSPIDINLAKQLNILLSNLGVPDDRIVIDPTTGGLGYGMEYSYSVMERARLAALLQEDEKLQYPLYCNLGCEIWKVKEAKQSESEAPELGDPKTRGVAMECINANSVLLAGADAVVLRHPESVERVRALIGEMLSDRFADSAHVEKPEPKTASPASSSKDAPAETSKRTIADKKETILAVEPAVPVAHGATPSESEQEIPEVKAGKAAPSEADSKSALPESSQSVAESDVEVNETDDGLQIVIHLEGKGDASLREELDLMKRIVETQQEELRLLRQLVQQRMGKQQ